MRSRRLSKRLRRETRAEHDLAEKTRFAKAFFAGRFDRRAYALGLAAVEPVYAALESALCNAVLQEVRAFAKPELFRLDAIHSDLALYGPAPAPDASPYARRILDVALNDPVALVGHFYVRTFADLSGMAMVAPLAHRLLGIPKSEPLAFFDFSHLDDRKALKRSLRAQLDALPSETHERILGEAKQGFALHRDLVEGLLDTIESTPTAPLAPVEASR